MWKTYENINAVVMTCVTHGCPQSRFNPKRWFENNELELGACPMPQKSPTKCLLSCAAFINPEPVLLGVSPEIRGHMLEALDVKHELETLKWVIKRSMFNLNGTLPLH